MPIYDISKSWLENLEEGPCFHEPIPCRQFPPESDWIDFLGFKVASRIGVPAGPLLDSKWIGFAASLGYDIVTYKTIRTHEHPSHLPPNIVPVETHGFLDPSALPPFLKQLPKVPSDIFNMGITNSFGNPSMSKTYLEQDIPLANSKLREGQVMIVSVFGNSVEDFVACALFAKNCGAKIIEANYSCPNISAADGSLFSSPDAVFDLSQKMVKALGDTPLIIKVGVFPGLSIMEKVFLAAAKAGVRAIAGINTISMKVVPALGDNRSTCGICGHPIHLAAVQFTKDARQIIDKNRLDLTLIATGGVTLPEHFENFFKAGADIGMSATGMMWNPFLALQESYAT